MTFIIMILIFGGAYLIFGFFCMLLKTIEIILDPRKLLMVVLGVLYILLLYIFHCLNINFLWSFVVIAVCCYLCISHSK